MNKYDERQFVKAMNGFAKSMRGFTAEMSRLSILRRTNRSDANKVKV